MYIIHFCYGHGHSVQPYLLQCLQARQKRSRSFALAQIIPPADARKQEKSERVSTLCRSWPIHRCIQAPLCPNYLQLVGFSAVANCIRCDLTNGRDLGPQKTHRTHNLRCTNANWSFDFVLSIECDGTGWQWPEKINKLSHALGPILMAMRTHT